MSGAVATKASPLTNPMPVCAKCGEEFPQGRKALGYSTCQSCGEQVAKAELDKKFKQALPSHHKGGYTYVSPEQQRILLRETTSKVARESEYSVGRGRVTPKAVTRKYRFSHWEWPVDKLGRRTKRAVFKEVTDGGES